jgi:hypothetical protein
MGYRSEVGFVVPSDAPKFEEIENCFEQIEEKDGYKLYTASWLKWYDDFEVVQAVAAYISKLEDEEKDFLFIRIGEEDSDLDVEGHFWDNPFNFGYVKKLTYDESVG